MTMPRRAATNYGMPVATSRTAISNHIRLSPHGHSTKVWIGSWFGIKCCRAACEATIRRSTWGAQSVHDHRFRALDPEANPGTITRGGLHAQSQRRRRSNCCSGQHPHLGPLREGERSFVADRAGSCRIGADAQTARASAIPGPRRTSRAPKHGQRRWRCLGRRFRTGCARNLHMPAATARANIFVCSLFPWPFSPWTIARLSLAFWGVGPIIPA